ncbi:MAG: hypothetical protein V4631_15215 [Pseudomonadota bacterium]
MMKLPTPPVPHDGVLDALVSDAGHLVASAASFAMALDQIGIELPPMNAAQIDQAQLRAVASLYLASELENTGLISAVETLAGLVRTGALGVDVGAATPQLVQFWQNRNQRASREEREHSFASLFGAGADGFVDGMLTLCEALYKLDERATNANYGGMAQQARVRSSAARVLAQLLGTAGGITVFLAQEILQSLREAIAILKHPQLLAALGARDVWTAIARIDRIAYTRHQPARLYVQRGRAGMTVLSWLAEAAPLLDRQTGALVQLDHPVIAAALEWMQAALSIGEAEAAAPSPTPNQAPGIGSPWSALAA